jgi:transposase-like protein
MAEERKSRRRFSSEGKATAVKRHVVGGEAVSVICVNIWSRLSNNQKKKTFLT